jgi:leucyl aminopeptidase
LIIKTVTGQLVHPGVDTLVVGVYEGNNLGGGADFIDKALDGALTRLVKAGDIKGKQGELTSIYSLGKLAADKVIVVGLGKKDELTLEKLRRIAGEIARFLKQIKAVRAGVELLGAGVNSISYENAAQALTEGLILGSYTFKKYQADDPEGKEVDEVRLVEPDANKSAEVESGCLSGRVVAEATCKARDMVNEPSNEMTPFRMAEIARRLADENGLACRVFEREEMKTLGMGALLGVAQGSEQPPKFIVTSYRGNVKSSRVMGWLGKAITFDSGGISLKPADGMELMKGDMSGGAAVINAIAAVAKLKLKVNVTAVVPATENLPSGKAQKPGDIVKAMNGKTIEVVNTDAEGRLILADALSYAVKEGLNPLIDLATLTGACHVALGEFYSGAFTNNEKWGRKAIDAGEEAGESYWLMPMSDDYRELIKSNVADIKNSGGRWGGAITAAKFLEEFVNKVPWVHLDIAGTAQTEKERGYIVKGATGVGVRTLISLAKLMEAEQQNQQ